MKNKTRKSLILDLGPIKGEIARMRFVTRWKSKPAAPILRTSGLHQEAGRGSGRRQVLRAESPHRLEDVVLIAEETRVLRTLISEAEIRCETVCTDTDRFRLIFLLQGEFGIKRVPGFEFADVESASRWVWAQFPCIKLTRILPDGQRLVSQPPQPEPQRFVGGE